MSQENHILILTPEIPYPVFKGNQSRIDQTIKVLIEEGYKVSIAILNFNQEKRTSSEVRAQVKSNYPGIHEVEVRRHPRFSKKAESRLVKKIRDLTDTNLVSNRDSCPDSYKRAVHRLVARVNPSHIIVNYIKLDRAIPRNYTGVRIVDTHDIQTNIISAAIKSGTFKKEIDIQKFESDEFSLLAKYDYVISINPNETREIKQRLPNQKILTLPAFNEFQVEHRIGGEIYDILFVGSASPFNAEGIKNFIRHCFPAIRKAKPDVKLAIAGEVSNIASVKALSNPNIVYLGRVDNLSKTYAQSRVVVSPIVSGAGMKVKNIEAFSHGMPLVATSFSMDGIEGTDGIHCFIKDDNKAFSGAVLELLNDNRLRARMCKNAYVLAKSFYSKITASRSYNSIITGDFTYRPDNLELSTASNAAKATAKPFKRTKALLYSSDADFLISYKIKLAEDFRNLGIYSEFVTMDANRANRFLASGFLVHATRPDLERKKRAQLKKDIARQISEAGKLDISLQGVNITDEIHTYKSMFPEHFQGKGMIDIAAHATLILESLLRRIARIQPDFIVGWNGNGPHFIFLMKVAAKIANLPIFHVERGLLPDTLVFDPQGVNFKSQIAGSYLPLINDEESDNARAYLESFSKSGKTIVSLNNDALHSRKEVTEALGIDEQQNYIFFPMQIEGDSNIIINSPFYKKMSEVLDDLVVVGKQLGVKIVSRPHPENKADISELRALYPEVEFNSTLHIHTLLNYSLANVVINSTVGLESLILQRPTIALGHSVYSSKGITFDAYHRDQIRKHIDRILAGEYDRADIERKTLALVHQLLTVSLIRLNAPAGENNEVIKATLMKNGITLDSQLPPPAPPQLARKYIEKLRQFEEALDRARLLIINNKLPSDSFQWLNGNTKPKVTQELIKGHFLKKVKASIMFLEKSDEAPAANAEEIIINIIHSKHGRKNESYSDAPFEFTVDEYFYPILS